MLTKALQVWGLSALNVDSEEVTKAQEPFEAPKEEAFICNLQVGPAVGMAVVSSIVVLDRRAHGSTLYVMFFHLQPAVA